MRIGIKIFLLLMTLGLCLSLRTEAQSNRSPQSQVDVLVTMLASGEVERVEILQIPARILTRARITPQMLEEGFSYKVTIRDIRGGAYQGEMIDALKSMQVRPRTEAPDLRWGIIFYGPDKSRLGALYSDQSGGNGVVGATPVSFNGRFFSWLGKSFSGCLR